MLYRSAITMRTISFLRLGDGRRPCLRDVISSSGILCHGMQRASFRVDFPSALDSSDEIIELHPGISNDEVEEL